MIMHSSEEQGTVTGMQCCVLCVAYGGVYCPSVLPIVSGPLPALAGVTFSHSQTEKYGGHAPPQMMWDVPQPHHDRLTNMSSSVFDRKNCSQKNDIQKGSPCLDNAIRAQRDQGREGAINYW